MFHSHTLVYATQSEYCENKGKTQIKNLFLILIECLLQINEERTFKLRTMCFGLVYTFVMNCIILFYTIENNKNKRVIDIP